MGMLCKHCAMVVVTAQEIVCVPCHQKEVERLRAVVRDLLFAYQNKDDECPHQFETDAVAAAKAEVK